jgi:DNA repair protein RecO (recombination protein O)
MEWIDEGIILGVRRHGETSAIVELMTPAHGRHLGLVRGGISRRMKPYLQPGLLVRFELQLLAELGFGLDLGECAATGEADELIYVSPKSGRAVSRAAGEPWKDQLLPLPGFLNGNGTRADAGQVAAGFALTEFFLVRRVYEPRGLTLPDARAAFLAAVARG